MKKVFGAVVAAVVLAACSDRATLSKVEEEGNAPEETATTETTTGTNQQALTTIDLRMRAVGAESYSQLLVVPNSIRIYADGQELAVTPTWREVHLENMAHAEKIGSFVLPEGVSKVHFKVEFGAAGGFTTADSTGWIDSRKSVVEFEATAQELNKNKLAVVMIDAQRSFVSRDETTKVLVPNFRVD